MSPTIDTIKAIFTYSTAALISVGGLAAIVLTRMEPDTKTIVGAFVGGALAFLYGQETATRASRSTTAASVSGATLHANGLSSGTGEIK